MAPPALTTPAGTTSAPVDDGRGAANQDRPDPGGNRLGKRFGHGVLVMSAAYLAREMAAERFEPGAHGRHGLVEDALLEAGQTGENQGRRPRPQSGHTHRRPAFGEKRGRRFDHRPPAAKAD